ncbi:MAG TPA: hypothetical protein VIJ96_05900 [Acidothermaceae bacterium]
MKVRTVNGSPAVAENCPSRAPLPWNCVDVSDVNTAGNCCRRTCQARHEDIAKAALVVNGHAEPQVVLDTSGFATLDASFTTGSASQDNMRVDLYDAGGRLVHTVEVATPAPG